MDQSNEAGSSNVEKPDSNRNPDSANQDNVGSGKVQFEAGTKEQDGSLKSMKKMKKSFKDVVKKDVIGSDQQGGQTWSQTMSSAKRGILKMKGDSKADSEKQSLCFVNKAYEADDDESPTADDAPHTSVATTTKSAFPFLTRGDSGRGFSGVVDLLVNRAALSTTKRDAHPYGRDLALEDEEEESRPKSNVMSNAISKLVLWMTLLSFLMGAAVGIIFLSETYNAKHRESKLLRAAMNATRDMTS